MKVKTLFVLSFTALSLWGCTRANFGKEDTTGNECLSFLSSSIAFDQSTQRFKLLETKTNVKNDFVTIERLNTLLDSLEADAHNKGISFRAHVLSPLSEALPGDDGELPDSLCADDTFRDSLGRVVHFNDIYLIKDQSETVSIGSNYNTYTYVQARFNKSVGGKLPNFNYHVIHTIIATISGAHSSESHAFFGIDMTPGQLILEGNIDTIEFRYLNDERYSLVTWTCNIFTLWTETE